MADNQRLYICALWGGSCIQDVTQCHASGAQIRQNLRIKGIRYEADVAVGADDAVIVYRDATALLASVLQGVKSHIGVADNAWSVFWRINSKYTASLMNLIKHQKFPFPVLVSITLFFEPAFTGPAHRCPESHNLPGHILGESHN